MARKRRQKKTAAEKASNMYFTSVVDDAIVQFQKAGSINEKNEIFTEKIYPVFDKLIESIIFEFRFTGLDTISNLKHECMINLFEALEKFNPDKKSANGQPVKAFSYYTVIAKHFFFRKINAMKRNVELKLDGATSEGDSIQENNNVNEPYVEPEAEIERAEFLNLLKEKLQDWYQKAEKVNEKKVIISVLELLKNIDDISIFNKKAFYIYLRAMTGNLNSKQIVSQLHKLKKKYNIFKKYYIEGEV